MAAQLGRLSGEAVVVPAGGSRKSGRISAEVLALPTNQARKTGRMSVEVLVLPQLGTAASADLNAAGSLTAGGSRTTAGTADLTAPGQISVTFGANASADLTAPAALTSAGTVVRSAASILAAAGSLLVDLAGALGAANLNAAGNLAATASATFSVGGGIITVDVSLTGELRYDRGLVAWDADISQRFLVDVQLSAVLQYFPAPVAPPAGLTLLPALRVSETMPTPTLDSRGCPVNWLPTSTVTQEWGRLQLIVGGVDVTFLRDVPALINDWSSVEPFGDAAASFTLPQVSEFDALGTGALAPFVGGAPVDLRLVRPDGSTTSVWTGQLVEPSGETSATRGVLSCDSQGALFQADWSVKPPSFALEARDIGDVIAETMNSYESRDYGVCRAVTTGIRTRSRGAWTPRLSGYIQDLLSTATTPAGDQWTVAQQGRVPVIRLKDRTTVNATFTIGQRGITTNLSSDLLGGANVIFGEGTDIDGCRWRNTKYPNLRTDDAPVYPLAAASVFTAGSATTGFAPFADEMRRSGYTMASVDTYSSADAAEVRDAQSRAGILVDGIVGPQTWAAIFQTGSDGGDLSGAYFAPIAFDARVEPRLHNAQGADIGANPTFDPALPRVERHINYGEGVSKAEATESALVDLARDADSGWQGTVTFATDPENMSRFELREGLNLLAKAHRGVNRMLHIARASISWQAGTVTCDVDTKARDLVTLAGIRSRNKDAAQDPGRRGSSQRRSSRNTQDSTSVFDCEAGAGIIPRHAVYRRLWTVLRIPAGQVGSIARTEYASDSPVAAYYVGVFSKPVTSNLIQSLVGDPSASESPWKAQSDALLDAGILEAWGSSSDPAGYFPGALSEGDPLTGRFRDGAGWSYESAYPPYLWVAEWSPVSTFLTGRMYEAVG